MNVEQRLARPGQDQRVTMRRLGACGVALLLVACSTPLGRHTVEVGESPEGLLLAHRGRTLVSLNTGDASLSLISLSLLRETARIALPMTQRRNPKGQGYGHVVDFAVDPDTDTVWVVSNVGHVFSVDLGTLSARAWVDHPKLEFMAAEWDPQGKRLFIGSTGGDIYEFAANGSLKRLVSVSGGLTVTDLEMHGGRLFYLSSTGGMIFGEGEYDSAFGAVDVKKGELVFETLLERGFLTDMTVSEGRVWAADLGTERLLEFSTAGKLLATRSIPGMSRFVDSSWDRVIVERTGGRWFSPAGVELSTSRHRSRATAILEYPRVAGGIPTCPARAYPVETGSVSRRDLVERLSAILALPQGGVAVALYKSNQVLILGESEARAHAHRDSPDETGP